jgi:hypothetical protein
MTKHTQEQIKALRKLYDIPEHFVPVATANGCVAWITKTAAGV